MNVTMSNTVSNKGSSLFAGNLSGALTESMELSQQAEELTKNAAEQNLQNNLAMEEYCLFHVKENRAKTASFKIA